MSSEFFVEQFNGDETDMAVLAAMHLEVRRWQVAEGQAKFRNGIHDSQPDLTDIYGRYIEPGGNFWVARNVEQNGVVGFVGLRRDDERVVTLKRLAVLPEYHHRGIGRLLVGTAVSWAAETGLDTIKLDTGFYENARPLYEQFGFTVVDEDHANEDFLMELHLR